MEGESWKLGDATVTVVYDGSQGTTYNECSIVLKVECDGKSILLTGDLPSVIETSLMEQGYNFKADILAMIEDFEKADIASEEFKNELEALKRFSRNMLLFVVPKILRRNFQENPFYSDWLKDLLKHIELLMEMW